MIIGFDDEKSLLKRMRAVPRRNIMCLHNSKLEKEAKKVFFPRFKDKVVDNSSQSAPPPDFYTNGLGLMADMIQINDYETSYINSNGEIKYLNALKEEESKAYKKFVQERNITEDKDDIVLITANPAGATYKKYFNGFERIYQEHAQKKEMYLANFPDCEKVGILIYDDAHLYLQKVNKNLYARHFPYYDYKFLKILKNSGMDFVVWYFDNKYLYPQSGIGRKQGPEIVIIDIAKIDLSKAIKYKEKTLICAEKTDERAETRIVIIKQNKKDEDK